jgi:hypothetical protein
MKVNDGMGQLKPLREDTKPLMACSKANSILRILDEGTMDHTDSPDGRDIRGQIACPVRYKHNITARDCKLG